MIRNCICRLRCICFWRPASPRPRSRRKLFNGKDLYGLGR